MNPCVFDASVAVKLLLREDDSPAAFAALEHFDPYAPDFVVTEVANVLWRRARDPALSHRDLPALVRAFADDLELVPTLPLVPAALELAVQTGATVYDCVYLALALRDGARLVTADERFAAAVTPHHPSAMLLLRDA